MRAQLCEVIGGIRYDTEKADIVASNEYWDGSNWERGGRSLHLYKTKKGRFFLGFSSRWQGERSYILPISEEEAKAKYEELPEHEMTYEEAFGIVPEEA